MFVPINNAFAGKMYTSKTTMHCLAHQTFDGIEWKVATCIERPPLHKDQFQIDTYANVLSSYLAQKIWP